MSYGTYYSSSGERTTSSNVLLLQPHRKYGFVEPVKYFTPAIGISDIFPIDHINNAYLIGAMGSLIQEGDMSLHMLTFGKNHNLLINHDIINIFDRIRSFTKLKENYLMILENNPRLIMFKINRN